MLEISNLCVSYKKQNVLFDLNLEIQQGVILGLLGKNGAGKTTLFEAIYQELQYTGEILWQKQKMKRENISYLETDNYFYPFITGKEYLGYFNKKSKKYEDLILKFNLPLEKFIQDYSSGMKKKIALLGMLMLDKSINILDEPFNGVDFEGVHILYDVIRELKSENKVVIVSSHIIETLFHTCDKIAILNSGKIDKIIEKENFIELQNFKF